MLSTVQFADHRVIPFLVHKLNETLPSKGHYMHVSSLLKLESQGGDIRFPGGILSSSEDMFPHI